MSAFTRPVYGDDFSSAVHLISTAIESWAKASVADEPFIDGFADCVFLTRADHSIAFANSAFREFYANAFLGTATFDGKLLDQATMGISLKSDELLLSSGRTLELEHISLGPSGVCYNVKTHKRWLASNRHNLTILGITRVLGVVERPLPSTAERLAVLAHKYEALESDDQVLCCLMAAGHSQREMAELLGCTTRTIENRRNRIMEELGATKPIDIVKLMVRLAEHGMIHADF